MNITHSHTIIHTLVNLGCDHFCVAPGARNVPLVHAVSHHKGARVILGYDERSLGFLAMGIGKTAQKPAAIVVTSGTAVANLMPSVVEAFMSHVPLIVLSADRPFDQWGIGAAQTIFQTRFFGDYVRYFCDIPPPTDSVLAPWLSHVITQGYTKACYLKGPVHLNCQFREPLLS